MREAIERFLVSKRAENASPNTIRAYRADLEDLSNFLGNQQGAERLSREIVRGFLALLHRRGANKTTAVRKLSAIKSFAHWLHSEEILGDDTFDKITKLKPPKTPDTLPDVPSEEEMVILLDGEFPTAFPQRDRLLCELMYGSGLRVAEVAQIRLDDLRPEQNAILINGKGGPYGKNAKHRLVPLNPHSREALEIYLIERDKMVKRYKLETQALFFAVRNRYSEEHRGSLDVRSIRRMLLQITKSRGLPPMHPHLLRHACATHMLDHGCPLDVIAKILGHDNIDVTAHYAQVSTRLMMETYNAAHPHAKQPNRTAPE
jgi:site-specific recombinase XerD